MVEKMSAVCSKRCLFNPLMVE